MIVLTLTLFISLILDGLVSNFVPISFNLFNPLFTIVAVVIICPYFYKNIKNYYIFAFVVGLLFDIIYTNTLFLNAIIFLVLAILIKYLNDMFSNSVLNTTFITIISIAVYRVLIYLLLTIMGYTLFSFSTLLLSIISSLILNIIYTVIIYIIVDKLGKKFGLKKID